MKTSYLALAVIYLVLTSKAYSQLGFAVALDENASCIAWRLSANVLNPQQHAVDVLKNMGYKYVYNWTGTDNLGYNLKKGYWIVVEAEIKDFDGATIKIYGAGADAGSSARAEINALKHLFSGVSAGFLSWFDNQEYKITNQGTF